MRGERRRPSQVRLDDAETVLVESGLIDADYVGAQLGTHLRLGPRRRARRRAGRRRVAAPALRGAVDRAPPVVAAPRPAPRPLVRLRAPPAQPDRAPPAGRPADHLRDATPRPGTTPTARCPTGCRCPRPGTALPTRILPRKVSWGTYRAAAIEAAAAWRREVVLERPELVGPTPALPGDAGHLPRRHRRDGRRRTPARSCARRSPRCRRRPSPTGTWWRSTAARSTTPPPCSRASPPSTTASPLVRESRCCHARALNVGARARHRRARRLPPARAPVAARHARLAARPRPPLRLRRRSWPGPAPSAATAAELLGGRPVDLATALLRRAAIKDVGGFDEGLGGSVERDLMLRLSRDHDPLPVDVPVLKRPDPGPPDLGDDWDSVVLERQLVDWDAAARGRRPTTSSRHVMPVGPEPRRTVEWLSSVPREGAELILVGVRLRRAHHVLAASIAAIISGARFVSVPTPVSMSAATNIGISQAAGSTVLLVRPEAMPPRQPIAGRLAEVVARAGRRASPSRSSSTSTASSSAPAPASPRSTRTPSSSSPGCRPATPYASGSAPSPRLPPRWSRCAPRRRRAARPRRPLPLRAGRDRPRPAGPAGGARRVGRRARDRDHLAHAVRRARRADRRDVVAAPASPRRAGARPGARPAAPRRASRSPTSATAGSRPTPRTRPPPSALVPELVVRPVQGIHESPPRLRWAIDIAAPAAQRGDRWGDTYFARSLADALESRGQHVAIDRRDARERDSRDHDDVLLVLRGLDRVAPRPGLLNVEWIISHPDMISPEEVAGFDHVYAASTSWSERMTREWGTPIEPLLQCTDTRWFHPDRAEPDTGPALLFVGNSRGVYRYAVRSALAIGADLTLHGNDWTEFVEREQIASGGVDNREVGVALRLRRHRAQRPPPRHAPRQLRLQPALRRRRLRRAHPQRPHRRARGDLRRPGAALRQRARARPPGAAAVRRVPRRRRPPRDRDPDHRRAQLRQARRDARRRRRTPAPRPR